MNNLLTKDERKLYLIPWFNTFSPEICILISWIHRGLVFPGSPVNGDKHGENGEIILTAD